MTDRKILPTVFSNFISNRMKFFVLVFLAFCTYFCIFYIYHDLIQSKFGVAIKVHVDLKYVIVHLDLKGSPPKLKYLESLLPMFKKYGVNGLLMEYEDMFPYEGKLVNLSAEHCYKRNELKSFLSKAVESGFEIIPLIQTFGHMEHVLKLKEFHQLREDPIYSDSICPSQMGSVEVIEQMLTQIFNFHASIAPLKHIHVGCDEVYHINKCSDCVSKSLTNMDIFLDHVRVVALLVRKINPNLTVLFWEDMFRTLKMSEWTNLEPFNKMEPVYWDYSHNAAAPHALLRIYHNKFDNIWIASAFKGADGRASTLPNFRMRFYNHLSWMNFIKIYRFGGERRVFQFKGIILTGWSRYSHMDPLCELLPASLPTLIFNLILIQTLRNGVIVQNQNFKLDNYFIKQLENKIKRELNCDSNVGMKDFDCVNTLSCSFEGVELINELKEYLYIKHDLENSEIYSDVEMFLKDADTVNRNRIQTGIVWCRNTLEYVNVVENMLLVTLNKYYDRYVIEEYLNYKTRPIKTKLSNLLNILKYHLGFRTWERRSFHSNTSAVKEKFPRD